MRSFSASGRVIGFVLVVLALLTVPVSAQIPGFPGRSVEPAEAEPAEASRVATEELEVGDVRANVTLEVQPEGETAATQPAEEEGINDTVNEMKAFLEGLHLDGLRANTYVNWLVLLGAIFIGLLAGKIASTILRRMGEGLDKRGWRIRGHFFMDMASPASLLLFTLGLWFGLAQLQGIHTDLAELITQVMLLLVAIAFFWYAYNLISIIEIVLRRLTSRTNSTLDDQLVPIVRKSLRIFLVILAVLFIFDAILGADIGAWLAGLGIAGLAVSLAAQDSLKNLFGSVTLLLDRPFMVGSFIKYAGEVGTVEEIGFRSTRMRTLGGHLITIPNSNIVNDPVENIGLRPNIRRVLDVTVTYDTPPEKIEEAIQIIRDLFEDPELAGPIHGENEEDFPPRVYFNNYNAASLNLVVYYWFRPAEWWDYMDHAQKFNLKLLRRFNEAGIEFAFPTQTLYLAGDPNRQLDVNVALERGGTGQG